MAETIIDVNSDKQKEEQMKSIAVNALKAMTDILVDMADSGMDTKIMMSKCVWPIIYEAADRFERIKKDEKNIPLDGFENITCK